MDNHNHNVDSNNEEITVLPVQSHSDGLSSKDGKVYCVSQGILVEGFEDGALVVRLEDRRLIELNTTAHDVIKLTDGQRSLIQVAVELANEYEITPEEALADLQELYAQLHAWKIVETKDANEKEN
jgi:hypothetical protein